MVSKTSSVWFSETNLVWFSEIRLICFSEISLVCLEGRFSRISILRFSSIG